MKIASKILIYIACALSSALTHAEAYKVKIGIESDYLNYLAFYVNGNPLEQIVLGRTKLLDRSMAEILIQARALAEAGFDFDVEFVPLPNVLRANVLAEQQRIDLLGSSYWSDDPDIGNAFLKSVPHIRRGEALVGFFTAENNQQAMAAKNLHDLQQLRFISVENWEVDKRNIKNISGKNVHYAKHFRYLMRMINIDRADVTLLEFDNKAGLSRFFWDKSKDDEALWLHPIPNVVTYLDAERVFVVAASSPKAQELIAALNRGIQRMRASGELKHILTQAGYYPRQVENWQVIDIPKAGASSIDVMPSSNTSYSSSNPGDAHRHSVEFALP
ncbi:hypothetical protein [Agaribacterium haliotis]|uniref:hypothetical protein n=1 Tax=Agaribacterium haliotis TaxID=2013869 RepID=UPI000BB5895B|nr:hypothetical protein [Agaribacterium haliotis]